MPITTQERIIFYTDKILNNADKIVPFQEYNFYLFSELKGLVFEITNCIMLDINQASICLTNHLLERTMKLSLIKYDMGKIKIGNPEFVNKIHSAYIKYDNLLLWETIKLAYEKEIINEGEQNLLKNLKGKYRNPFSHANSTKILPAKLVNESFTGYKCNIEEGIKNLAEGKPIPIEEISISSLTTVQEIQNSLSDCNAFDYFKKVFDIMKSIDDRYKIKYNIKMP